MSNSLQPHGLQPTSLLRPWDFPGKNTGVGCHFLLQRIFSTQDSNPCLLRLLHWQVGSLPPAPTGKHNNYITQIVSILGKLVGTQLQVGLPWLLSGKESACHCRRCRLDPWVRKMPWRRKWQPTPVFLSREFHGQGSLAWGHRESDTTEQVTHNIIQPGV